MEQTPFGMITNVDFLQGISDGYERFILFYEQKILTESDIFAFVAHTLFYGAKPGPYNIGYITGWYQALFDGLALHQAHHS